MHVLELYFNLMKKQDFLSPEYLLLRLFVVLQSIVQNDLAKFIWDFQILSQTSKPLYVIVEQKTPVVIDIAVQMLGRNCEKKMK